MATGFRLDIAVKLSIDISSVALFSGGQMRIRMELAADSYAACIARAMHVWTGRRQYAVWPSVELW